MRKNGRKSLISKHVFPAKGVGAVANNSLMDFEDFSGQRGDMYGPNKSKFVPRQAEVALGVPGRLRPRIISTFGTTRVVGRQPYAPAASTPREIPGTHFQRLSRPQGTCFCRKEPPKKSPVTPPGIDPGTVQLVAQCLNHYATPGPPPKE